MYLYFNNYNLYLYRSETKYFIQMFYLKSGGTHYYCFDLREASTIKHREQQKITYLTAGSIFNSVTLILSLRFLDMPRISFKSRKLMYYEYFSTSPYRSYKLAAQNKEAFNYLRIDSSLKPSFLPSTYTSAHKSFMRN